MSNGSSTGSTRQRGASRSRGGQPGNTNALRHGFYSRNWKYRDCKGLEDVDPVSLTDEIALMRVCIRRLSESIAAAASYEEQLRFIRTLSHAIYALNRMVRTQKAIMPPEGDLQQILSEALRDITRELEKDSESSA